MRVLELAKELKVETEALLHLLREMGIAVKGVSSQVSEAAAAKVIARMERGRRSGAKDASEAMQAAVDDAASGPRRRRRRKIEEPQEPESEPPPPEPEEIEAVREPEPEATVEVQPEPEPKPKAKPAKRARKRTVKAADKPEASDPEPEPEVTDTVVVGEEPATPSAESESKPQPQPQGAPEPLLFSPVPARPEGDEHPQAADFRAPPPEAPGRRLRKPVPAASAGPAGTVRIQAEGYTPDGRKKGPQDKKKGKKRQRVDQDAVAENISRVMAEIKSGSKKRRRKGALGQSREDVELAEAEAQGGGRARGQDRAGERVPHRRRAGRVDRRLIHRHHRIGLQEPWVDGHHQPASRLRSDRTVARRVRFPCRTRGRVCRPSRGGG